MCLNKNLKTRDFVWHISQADLLYGKLFDKKMIVNLILEYEIN